MSHILKVQNIFVFTLQFIPVFLFITLFGRLMSRYRHTDSVHNSGLVWSRVLQIHPALLQQVEVTVNVATDWGTHQLPVPTKGILNKLRRTVTNNTSNNSIDIRTAESLHIFRRRLRTHLFRLHFEQ